MVALALLAALAAPPFWEARPPEAWSREEIGQLLSDSPWAQAVAGPFKDPGVIVYLATARPAREAERELMRRGLRPAPAEGSPSGEYEAFLRENGGRVIVLAVRVARLPALEQEPERRRLEQDCVLKVGKRKYHLIGHFPPTPEDPCLRLVFPREVGTADKALRFELYLPGLPNPDRWAEFRLREMNYRGEAAY
jgi:hypothetical protein